MATDTESFNKELYDLLKVRGYKPVPLDAKNQRVPASQTADVLEFQFIKDGEDYGKAWLTIDDAQNVVVYYDDEQQNSPSSPTPGVEYDDSWTGFLKHLKNWAQRRQLSFELANKDRLGDDMRQREYYKMKEKLGESKQLDELSPETMKSYKDKATASRKKEIANTLDKTNSPGVRDAAMHTQGKRAKGIFNADKKLGTFKDPNWGKGDDNAWIKRDAQAGLTEGYHAMGKKASYNDAVPNVKIILQHNRALEEGEARFRNVSRIFLENADGERFLAPTTRPGIARVYARHIAEGGLPNDDRWNHIKSICEDYNKMAGFVRATKNGQFNESAQQLVNEGAAHYANLRETLNKLTGHKGYHAYFESWTPTLMEGDGEDISEMFMSSSMDPRIEAAMPILSRLKVPVTEMEEVDSLAEWADGIINEKLELEPEEVDEDIGDQIKKGIKSLKRGIKGWEKGMHDVDTVKAATKTLSPDSKEELLKAKVGKGSPAELQQKLIKREKNKQVDEVLDTRDAKMSYAKKNMDSHKKALDDYMHYDGEGQDADKKADAHKTAMKRVRGLNTFVKNKVSKDEEVKEDLGTEQKRVGQLGPTEKVRNNNIGKLVGASESMNYDDGDLLAEGILDTIKSRVKSFIGKPKAEPAAPAEPKRVGTVAPAQPSASGLNDYIKNIAAELNAADQKTKIALVKELVGVMADRKGYPEWDNVIGSVKGILKRAGVNPNLAAAANAKLQAGQTFESAMQEAINVLLESTGLTMQILNEGEDELQTILRLIK